MSLLLITPFSDPKQKDAHKEQPVQAQAIEEEGERRSRAAAAASPLNLKVGNHHHAAIDQQLEVEVHQVQQCVDQIDGQTLDISAHCAGHADDVVDDEWKVKKVLSTTKVLRGMGIKK